MTDIRKASRVHRRWPLLAAVVLVSCSASGNSTSTTDPPPPVSQSPDDLQVSLDGVAAPETGAAMITGVLSNETDDPIEFYPGWSLEQWTGEAWTKVDDAVLGTEGSPGRNCSAGCEYMPAVFISEPGDQYDFVLLLLPPITEGTYRLAGSTSTSPPFVLTPEILRTENT